jgi:DNA-binding FrmR family transcriptional regulator
MQIETKTAVLKRLKRIEGQVRGLARMVEEDRYCIDVVTQISAVRAALRRAEEEILRDHVAHCVEHAIASGDRDDQRQKIAEIMDVLARADRETAVRWGSRLTAEDLQVGSRRPTLHQG